MLGSKRQKRGVQEALTEELIWHAEPLELIRAKFLPKPKLAIFDKDRALIGHAFPTPNEPGVFEFSSGQAVTVAYYCIDDGWPLTELHPKGPYQMQCGDVLRITMRNP